MTFQQPGGIHFLSLVYISFTALIDVANAIADGRLKDV